MTKLPLFLGAMTLAALLGFSPQNHALEACSDETAADEACIGPSAGALIFDNSDTSNAEYRFEDADGTTQATQAVFAVDCDLSFDAETLVTYELGAGYFQTIGFNSEGSRGGSGQPCGNTEANQFIEWRLTGALVGKISTRSSMTLEFKNATGDPVWGQVETYLDDELMGMIEFRSGPVLFDPTDPAIESLRRGRTATQNPMLVTANPSYCYDSDGVPVGLVPASGDCADADPTGILPPAIDHVNFAGLVDSGPDRSEGDNGKLVFNNRANRWVLRVFAGGSACPVARTSGISRIKRCTFSPTCSTGACSAPRRPSRRRIRRMAPTPCSSGCPTIWQMSRKAAFAVPAREVLYNLEWLGETLEFISPLGRDRRL